MVAIVICEIRFADVCFHDMNGYFLLTHPVYAVYHIGSHQIMDTMRPIIMIIL